jgi:hypothetical protein
MAADQFDVLFLAEAEFTQTVADFGRGGKLLDANGRAHGHATQRAKWRSSALAGDDLIGWNRFLHDAQRRLRRKV